MRNSHDAMFYPLVMLVCALLFCIGMPASVAATAYPGQAGNSVGYAAAPGYPGALTVFSGAVVDGASPANPTVYSFQDFVGGLWLTNQHNITFVGCRFQATGSDAIPMKIENSTNITFQYCSFVPLVATIASPPHADWPSAGAGTGISDPNSAYTVPNAQGYFCGIDFYNQAGGASTGPAIIDHCDIWGMECGINFDNTSAPIAVTNNWIHDCRNPNGPNGLNHSDGLGYLVGGTPPSNVTVIGNTIASIANTQAIGWQASTSAYDNIVMTNNYLSGFGNTLGLPKFPYLTNSRFTDNVFGTDIAWQSTWIYGGHFDNEFTTASGKNNIWRNNTLHIRPGGVYWGNNGSVPNWTNAMEGYYALPDTSISPTDWITLGGDVPQYPTLLNGYALRPSFSVPAVDYYVGVPGAITLKNPALISIAGVSVNTASHLVTVSGSGITLDGYDFSLNGGYDVYILGSNTTIQNCRFGASGAPIDLRGAGLTVRHCTFEGGGDALGAQLWCDASGALVAEYNYFIHAQDDAIDMGGSYSSIAIRFNAFVDVGMAAGSHPDTVQEAGTITSSLLEEYNLIYQSVGGGETSGEEGIQVSAQLGGKITGATLQHNTLVAKGPALTMSYEIYVAPDGGVLSGVTLTDNYLDPTGSYGGFYPGQTKNASFIANYNMVTGARYPDSGAPAITTQPASVTVTAEKSATFTVVANGTPPLSYQWRKNGIPISGAAAASYTTPATTASDNGALFAVVVSNPAGSITSSNATLTVNAAPIPPLIVTQPADITVTAGQSATFSVLANGTAPLNYQWRKNGAAIAGATGSLYTTPATALSDSGAVFAVIVSNSTGSVTSNNATLTVNAAAQGSTLLTTQTPALENNADGPGVNFELGMRFSSSAPGTITAIRFWKDSLETGTHTGHIWDGSGKQLASVVFSGETASGWQEQPLATPLSIIANTEYLVSVNTSDTYYVATNNGLASQIVNGTLSSIIGGNGRYGSVGQYPTQTYQSSNYFRDVRFVASNVNSPPAITSSASATPNPAMVGQCVTLSVGASDPDGDTLIHAWAFGDSTTGIGASTTHVYTTAGSYTALVTVSDGHSHTVTSSVVVTINPTAPSINSALTANGTVGTAFSYTITASNNPTGFNATGLLAGLSVNTSTGVISGTPTTAGTSNVTISATNASGTGSATLVLTVNSVGTYVARINFQPMSSPAPAGYKSDDGSVYTTARGYGWNAWGVVDSRQRNVNPDPRLDTFVFGSSPATWTYTIANGNYLVTLAVGDASYAQGPHLVTVQGTVAVNKVTTQANQFVTVTNFPVTVTTGKLTIVIGGGGGNTMLNYVDIMPATASPASGAAISATLSAASLSVAPAPFTVQKLAGTIDFQTTGHDGMSLVGAVPGLPFVSKLSGETVQVWIGGEQGTFKLDAKGYGKSSAGTLSLTSKGGAGAIKVALKGGTWSQPWSDAGIDPNGQARRAKLKVNVMVSIGGTFYSADVAATYSSKARVGGKFRH